VAGCVGEHHCPWRRGGRVYGDGCLARMEMEMGRRERTLNDRVYIWAGLGESGNFEYISQFSNVVRYASVSEVDSNIF
jgi:hypothetical protein